MKLRLRIYWEIEASPDCPADIVHQAELIIARYTENEEARIDQVIQESGLAKVFHVGKPEEEL